MDFTIDVG